MRKIGLILGVVALVLLLNAGWQLGSCELANIELRDDLKDLAAQNGARIGLKAPVTDGDLRQTIISKAGRYGISLDPEQVTIQHVDDVPSIYLAAKYKVQVQLLPNYWIILHFAPSSRSAR